MAGLGYKTFNANDVLTAAQVQGYLQDQAVMLFASAPVRTSALASPTQGMTSYLFDSNSYWQYYDVYNAATNPSGASVAGWYLRENTNIFSGKRTTTATTYASGGYLVTNFNTFSIVGSTTNTDTLAVNSLAPVQVMTVRKAGWYQLSYNVANDGWSALTGTLRGVIINRNSTTATTNVLMRDEAAPTTGFVQSESAAVLLAANDSLRMWLYQNSGSTLTQVDQNLSITYLRPASV